MEPESFQAPQSEEPGVLGNYIGVDSSGTRPLGNRDYGVLIGRLVRARIGAPGAGNIISANGKGGIRIERNSDQDHKIQGNFIGMGLSGQLHLGNGFGCAESEQNCGHGLHWDEEMFLGTRTLRSEIGGAEEGEGNTIAFNKGAGIYIHAGEEARIRSNRIYDNGGLGIDLYPLGINANSKPQRFPVNRLEPFPVLELALLFESTVTISGQLPRRVVEGRIDVFSSPSCDPSGNGEGEVFLGPLIIPSPERDHVVPPKIEFRGSVPARNASAGPMPHAITAVWTSSSGNSSEFSACKVLELDSDGDTISDQIEDRGPNGGDCDRNGVPDRMQRAVTALPNAIDGRYLCGILLGGIPVISTVSTPAVELKPDGVLTPLGVLEATIELGGQGLGSNLFVQAGGEATLTLTIPEGIQVDSYYNFGPTPQDTEPHWYEFLFDGETGAEIFADRIILHFVDGQRGDHDLTENGRITTLGGPVVFGFSLYFPFNRSDETDFTGFAVSNFSESETLLEMTAFDTEGVPLIAFDNPVYFQLQGGSQLARLGTDIFDLGTDTPQDGWVQLISKEEGIGSFFQAGGGSKLDGSVAASDKSETLYFTRVFEGPTEYRGHAATTSLSIANPNLESVTIDLELLGNPGSQGAVSSSALLQSLAPRQ